MPTTDASSIFGRLVSARDVRNAVVDFLRTWVPTYVGEMERQGQLKTGSVPMPPDPKRSYRGGLDFETWEPSWSPMFIVVVLPYGKPELAGGGGAYLQSFEIQIGCNYQYNGRPPSMGEFEEDSSVQYADILGMAACAAVVQHGSLGEWADGSPVSVRTRLATYPNTSFPFALDEASRRVCRSTFTVIATVADVVIEGYGPSEPLENPYPDPGDWPIVEHSGVEVIAVPLDEDVPDETTKLGKT